MTIMCGGQTPRQVAKLVSRRYDSISRGRALAWVLNMPLIFQMAMLIWRVVLGYRVIPPVSQAIATISGDSK